MFCPQEPDRLLLEEMKIYSSSSMHPIVVRRWRKKEGTEKDRKRRERQGVAHVREVE